MKHLIMLASCVSVAMFSANASAQESPRVQITIKISDKTPSFSNHRLVVALTHNHPLQDDRDRPGSIALSMPHSRIGRKETSSRSSSAIRPS